VVLDAWHPNWREEINGNETIVHKVNGVFKGVSLPSGEGVVRLYFDNKPYFIGVWISLGAWLFFLVAWMMASRFCRKVY
jgi:uncharacterized membrane protein YfhO